MKHLILFPLLFSYYFNYGQDFIIDFSNNSVKPTEIEMKDDVIFHIMNCDTNDLKYDLSTNGQSRGFDIIKNSQSLSLPIGNSIKENNKVQLIIQCKNNITNKITLIFSYTDNKIKCNTTNSKASNPENTNENKNIFLFNESFINSKYLFQKYAPKISDCIDPIVEYDICCNKYCIEYKDRNIWFRKKDDCKYRSLRYYNKICKNRGVVFFLNNLNTYQYEASIGNKYFSSDNNSGQFMEIQKLLLPSGATLTSAQNDTPKIAELSIELIIAKILKLNNDLKEFQLLLQNTDICTSNFNLDDVFFDINNNIRNIFEINNNYETFETKYIEKRDAFIQYAKIHDPKYDLAKFNEEYKKGNLNDVITPDDLVMNTRRLYNSLASIKFHLQYNVPQIKNYDFISFVLNVKPKEGFYGPLRIVDQEIEIPIHGGYRLDFSTGFYYSNVANQKYSLKNVIEHDTIVRKIIIDDNEHINYNNTIGIAALLHFYVRSGSIQPSICLGMGSSLDLNYSLLFGGGLILGSKNRVMISGGLNFSSVKRLSNSNPITEPVHNSVTTINYNDRIVKGGFISVTYSLSGTKVMQVAQPVTAATEAPATEAPAEGSDDKTKNENK